MISGVLLRNFDESDSRGFQESLSNALKWLPFLSLGDSFKFMTRVVPKYTVNGERFISEADELIAE